MTPEEILDLYYEKGMHWKSVNRERVVAAMEEYAWELKAENEKMRGSLEKIIDRCERGIYDATDVAFVEEVGGVIFDEDVGVMDEWGGPRDLAG